MEQILIMTTGGTIDKVYFDARSSYEVGPPQIIRMLDEREPAVPFRVLPLLRKDSLELNDDDRRAIFSAAADAVEHRIVITHGTDTMVETGRFLLPLTSKTIVLTGALAPALFADSDAPFNVGGALIAAQVLPPGVFIVMNGTVFPINDVRKNAARNRFERFSDSAC